MEQKFLRLGGGPRGPPLNTPMREALYTSQVFIARPAPKCSARIAGLTRVGALFGKNVGPGGAGTNFKVGEGHRSCAKRQKKFFGRATPLFGSKSRISRFGERFRDGQFLICCSSTHGAPPPCPSICKSKGAAHVPPVPYGVSASVGAYPRDQMNVLCSVAPTLWGTGVRAPNFTNGWARGAP